MSAGEYRPRREGAQERRARTLPWELRRKNWQTLMKRRRKNSTGEKGAGKAGTKPSRGGVLQAKEEKFGGRLVAGTTNKYIKSDKDWDMTTGFSHAEVIHDKGFGEVTGSKSLVEVGSRGYERRGSRGSEAVWTRDAVQGNTETQQWLKGSRGKRVGLL